MNKEIHFKIPLFPGIFGIILTDDKKFIREVLDEEAEKLMNGDFELYAHSVNGSYKGKQSFWMILNLTHSTTKIFYGTVAHEAFHIVRFIAENGGFEDEEEAQAYLTDWVIDNTFKYLNDLGLLPLTIKNL